MKNLSFALLTGTIFTIILLSLFPNQHVMSQNQIPLEDFFRNPEKTAYQISPDGKYFSFMAPYESRMNIFVQKVGSDKATRLTGETDRDIVPHLFRRG